MKRKAGRVDRNDVKARAAAMRQKKAAAEAAAAIFVLSDDHWSVRRAHAPSIEKIAAVAAMVRRFLPRAKSRGKQWAHSSKTAYG